MHRTSIGCFGINHFAGISDFGHDDWFVVDECFEVFSLCDLRVAVIEKLVQEFVQQYEVLTNRFFRQGTTVIFEDFGYFG